MVENFVADRVKGFSYVQSRSVDAAARELKIEGVDVLCLSGSPWQLSPEHMA